MTIGFIGLGTMGEPMSQNIVKNHNGRLYVYDLVPSHFEQLLLNGAVAGQSAIDVAAKSDIIISMLPKSEHSLALYSDILGCLDHSKICIDMSTIDPDVSIKIATMVKATGADFFDAPVVKSKPAAISATLGIYIGGDSKNIEAIKPILAYMGSNIIHMGGNGQGLAMKICHNALVSQIQNGVNETIELAHRYHIDIDQFVTAISYGGGQNFYLDAKAQAIKSSNFSPAFSVENMDKDIKICLTMASRVGLAMKSQEQVAQVYQKAIERGYAQEDFSATIKVIKEHD